MRAELQPDAQAQAAEGAADRFTRLCLRGRWDPAALEAAREMANMGDLDWDAWRQAADAEALSPLLYRILQGRGFVPAAIAGRLQAAYHQNARRNMLIFHELGNVLRSLTAQGIPVMLLKGAALAETVYGNIALRPMGDLDLLLHREHVPRALKALEAAGYVATQPEARAGLALEYENELALVRPGPTGIPVELHWNLLDSTHHQDRLPTDWLWQTARPVDVESVQTWILGPTVQLLHLCAHLALHHQGEGLLWRHDIAEVIQFYRDDVDWEELLARASAFDLVLPLQAVLPQIAEGWGAPVPLPTLERLRALQPSAAESTFFRRLTSTQRPVAQRFWTDLSGMGGWQARLDYAGSALFPSPAYMRLRYGVPHPLLLPLYYPYRWWVGLRELITRRRVSG